jgi:cell division septal protein FtsQ
MNLLIRRRTAGRRNRRTRRSSPLISRTRLLAAFGVGLVTAAFYLVSVESVFAVDPARVSISGATFADTAQIRQDLQLPGGGGDTAGSSNVFQLTTEQMEQRLESIPSVLSANVEATLPNQLVVRIRERQPVLVWHTANASWLVDPSGFVIASAASQQSGGTPLPVIDDLRQEPESLAPGAQLQKLDIDVARLLGGLTPSQLGSAASALVIAIDDSSGWTITDPDGWRAIFGHYTSELHTTADIPQQVQCLASLLADRESHVETITLAVATDRCGTFTDNGSAAKPGGGKPNASAKPGPDASLSVKPNKHGKPPKANADASPQPTPKTKHNKPPKGEATPTPRPSR